MHIGQTLAVSALAAASCAQSFDLYDRDYESLHARDKLFEAKLQFRAAYDEYLSARAELSHVQRRGLGLTNLLVKTEAKTIPWKEVMSMMMSIHKNIMTCIKQKSYKEIREAEEEGKKTADKLLADYPSDSKEKSKVQKMRDDLKAACQPGDIMKLLDKDEIEKYDKAHPKQNSKSSSSSGHHSSSSSKEKSSSSKNEKLPLVKQSDGKFYLDGKKYTGMSGGNFFNNGNNKGPYNAGLDPSAGKSSKKHHSSSSKEGSSSGETEETSSGGKSKSSSSGKSKSSSSGKSSSEVQARDLYDDYYWEY